MTGARTPGAGGPDAQASGNDAEARAATARDEGDAAEAGQEPDAALAVQAGPTAGRPECAPDSVPGSALPVGVRDALADRLADHDMGKVCLRFSSPRKVDLDLIRDIARATAATPGPVC